ncbi:unnamed protein product [Polarella glacialis]|uniref:Uncharacterized protein n=1 Tax=Polarella glacialis TaxID=89957 RepID=A0A813K6B8_POLGL|nr:unnamed protein product [Polarella glacialis]
MLGQRVSFGQCKEREDEEQLHRCIGWICRWLQACNIVEQQSPAYCERVTAHLLANDVFIAETVRCLCPTTHVAQRQLLGEGTSALELAAACLESTFKAVHAVDIGAEGMIQRTLRAGEADLEPVCDVVLLWRHLLTYAVYSEEKERHVQGILQLDPEVQAGLMQAISIVEERLAGSCEPQAPGTPCKVRDGQGFSARTPGSTHGRFSGSMLIRRMSTSPGGGDLHEEDDLTLKSRDDPTVEALAKENASLRAYARQLGQQVAKDKNLKQRSNTVLDGEFETFEASWVLEKRVKEQEDQIRDLTEQASRGKHAMEELQQLYEQVELARVRDAEYATLQARFERCSQRLEDAGDLKVELMAAVEKTSQVSAERDAMSQELLQLRSTSQQLDAWKAKVRSLELCCGEAEAKLRGAETKALSAEAEKQRILGENGILEDKLKDAEVQEAALRESLASGSSSGGALIEPFTLELKESMRSLENRNALLEQRLGVEGSERAAQLEVEVEHLTGLKAHFEQRHQETIGALNSAQTRLEVASRQAEESTEELARQAFQQQQLESQLAVAEERATKFEEELQRVKDVEGEQKVLHERCKANLETVRRTADLLQEELGESRAAVIRAEEEREDAKMELEAQSIHLEELRRQCSVLQQGQSEVQTAQRERDSLLQRELAVEGTLRRLKEELEANDERSRSNAARVTELETSKRTYVAEAETLKAQLRTARCEQSLRERCREGYAEREELWAQQQGELMERFRDLHQGLMEEAKKSTTFCEQAKASERRAAQLEELLQRFAPAELALLEKSGSANGAAARYSPRPPGLQGDLLQFQAENRNLHAQLTEMRLRSADESQQLAKMAAKLRRFEKEAEQRHGSVREAEPSLALVDRTAGDRLQKAVVEGSVGRMPLAELNGNTSRRTSVGGHRASDELKEAPALAPKPAARMPLPRHSILKKPKEDQASVGKENSHLEGHKATSLVSKRVGLIGLCSGAS